MKSGLIEPSLYAVKAILILDNSGDRVIAKYYDQSVLPTLKEQRAFEKKLFGKTHRNDGEIVMLEGFTCLYKNHVDLLFYVIGSSTENELMLMSVLNCLFDSITQILRKVVELSSLLENLDVIYLAVDEICDNGIILECDSSAVVRRVSLRGDDIPLVEQTMTQVLLSAREQLRWSLLK